MLIKTINESIKGKGLRSYVGVSKNRQRQCRKGCFSAVESYIQQIKLIVFIISQLILHLVATKLMFLSGAVFETPLQWIKTLLKDGDHRWSVDDVLAEEEQVLVWYWGLSGRTIIIEVVVSSTLITD